MIPVHNSASNASERFDSKSLGCECERVAGISICIRRGDVSLSTIAGAWMERYSDFTQSIRYRNMQFCKYLE